MKAHHVPLGQIAEGKEMGKEQEGGYCDENERSEGVE
jgi:hypothetical protein